MEEKQIPCGTEDGLSLANSDQSSELCVPATAQQVVAMWARGMPGAGENQEREESSSAPHLPDEVPQELPASQSLSLYQPNGGDQFSGAHPNWWQP